MLALAAVAAGQGYEAVTKPSRDLSLSFVRPGKIASVLVREGQMVQPGQVLIQQDDRVEQIQVREQKQKAEQEGDIRTQAAIKKLEQTKVDLQELQEAAKHGAATSLEVQHSQLEMEMSALSLDVQKLTQASDKMKYEELKAACDQMRLESPVAGRVEEILVREGEAAPSAEKAIRVVRLDPLWIDLLVPLEDTRSLQEGGQASVTFVGSKQPSASGKIVFISDVAVSERRTIRVELPNSSLRPAGEPVSVTFTQGPAPQPTTMPAEATPTADPAAPAPVAVTVPNTNSTVNAPSH